MFVCIDVSWAQSLNALPSWSPVVPPEEEQSSVVELLADLANTVSELSSTITQLRQSKDTEQEALNNTM